MPAPEGGTSACSYSASMMEASATGRGSGLPASQQDETSPILERVWPALTAAWAAFTGILPHVLHHAGPLAGAALFAGAGGSVLFFAIGLLAAVPFLRRLHRRFGGWAAPGIAIALFVLVFSFSTFVIGPEISGGGGADTTQSAPTESPAGHGGQGSHGH